MKNLPDLAALSLEEKIGQMLCFGWLGPDALLGVNTQAHACVRDWKVGAMIVMGRNVQDTRAARPVDVAGVRALLDEMQSLADIPLLLPTDQEGGRVARFGVPFTVFPPAQVVGLAGDVALAQKAARATAWELSAVGVNWNFAPVADIHSNPNNPVIGNRSFGARPDLVATMVRAQIAGFVGSGVLSCAKHFPGHGDTALDSHTALPTVFGDGAALEARELIPFRAAVAANVDTIMTAHIRFPDVDPSGLPATLSAPLLDGLLRRTLGFDGLVVTDCLEMKAVADHWGTPGAAVAAAKAGADMLLVCHTFERQRATRDALLQAARSGDLPLQRIDEAVGRVLAAKRNVQEAPPPDTTRVGAPEHGAVAWAIVEKAGVVWDTPPAVATLGEPGR